MGRKTSLGRVFALGSAVAVLCLAGCRIAPPTPPVPDPLTLVCENSGDLCDADESSSALVYSDGSERIEYIWLDDPDAPPQGATAYGESTAELTTTGGSTGGVAATGSSSAFGEAELRSIVALLAAKDSSVSAVVIGGSDAAAHASDGSTIDIRAEGGSVARIVASGGSDASVLLLGGSRAGVNATGGSAVSVEARNGSLLDVVVEGSAGAVDADDSTVAVSARNGSEFSVEASDSEVELGLDGATGDVVASGGASVSASATDGGSVSAYADDAYASAQADGPGAEASVDALDGAEVHAIATSNDADNPAGVYAYGSGAAVVTGTAEGAGSRIEVVGYQAVDADGDPIPVTTVPVIRAWARNGGEVTTGAGMLDGAKIEAIADGEGSSAYVAGYELAGYITVIATGGGHAFVYQPEDRSQPLEFGCVGGQTRVQTDAGYCVSDGDRAVYTYPDGTEVVVESNVDDAASGARLVSTTTTTSTTATTAGPIVAPVPLDAGVATAAPQAGPVETPEQPERSAVTTDAAPVSPPAADGLGVVDPTRSADVTPISEPAPVEESPEVSESPVADESSVAEKSPVAEESPVADESAEEAISEDDDESVDDDATSESSQP